MSRVLKIVLTIIGIVALAIFLWWQSPHQKTVREARLCFEKFEDISQRTDCWYGVLESRVVEDGVRAAFKSFAYIYDAYDEFGGSECHAHAHTLGDIVYYNYYLKHPDLEKIDFPKEASTCGYGVFHGFLEHFVQDNPSPAVVTSTCNYLYNRYAKEMGAIRPTCYHGSGHGFMLARVEELSSQEWGDLAVFVQEPLEKCDALVEATENEKEECREGIFNVIINWAEGGEYHFEFDSKNPLAPCDALLKKWRHACYFEYAQKLSTVALRDLDELWRVSSSIRDPEYAEMIFQVGAAGLIQKTTNSDEYKEKVSQCLQLDDRLAQLCVSSLVWGLFEHGPAQREYETPLALCTESVIAERGLQSICYERVGARLRRFYDTEFIERVVCPQFPEGYRESCKRT